MQGSKNYQDSLFFCVSMNDLVPADHLVRKLREVVDLDWVRFATAGYYSGMGRPSVDPIVIAKMLLLSFLVGIDSERELMRQIQVNIAYRWYLGYSLEENIPNHSVLSYIERAEQTIATRRGKELLKVRQTCIEGLFGQAKQWHGMARARWRGLDNVEIQVLITAAVLNM
ncbi:MAG: transposase [Anaerohalosphaera sp.]|nr:transposase [Anaerohalosphaera sp.]